ncbi:MAG: hypothetical protein ACJ790_01235 [Myxococcaceae bacterium]
METVESATNVIAFPGLVAAAEAARKLRSIEQATVSPPMVPYVKLLTTDPCQKLVRLSDNAFRIEGVTADSAILQTLMELTVENRLVRIALGRAESATRTGQRVCAATPPGFRAELRPSLPLGSVIVSIERDDESRRETAAA